MKKISILLLIVLMVSIVGCGTVDEPGYVVATDGSQVELVDNDRDSLTIDSATTTITTIEYEHHEIHDGTSYIIQGNDDDLDNGQTMDLTVITPNTPNWMHAVWSAEGTAAIHIFVYEGSTTNITGAILISINRDRNSTNTAGGTFRDGDTFTALGTLLWEWHTGDKKISGIGLERDEFILRQNTQYLFRVESEVNDNKVSGQLSWYEHNND